MSGGFHVDTEAMRKHASNVQGVRQQAGTAVDAARQVSFGANMYGQIGQMLVFPLMLPLQEAGVASTEAVSDMLGDTAEGITGLADSYDVVETAVTGLMDKLKELTS